MTTSRDKAAEIVGQHVKCGWSICDRRPPEWGGPLPPLDVCPNINPSCRDIAEKIVDHLDGAGLLAPDLPAPDIEGSDGTPWWKIPSDEAPGVISIVFVDHDGIWAEGEWVTPAGARKRALALLAAADLEEAG